MVSERRFDPMAQLRFWVARFAMWFCGAACLYWMAPEEWEEYMSTGKPYKSDGANREPSGRAGDEVYACPVRITEDGKCSSCGEQLDFDDLSNLDFQVEESGVQPDTQYGPPVYWAAGTIACTNCQVRLPFEMSS